MEEINSAENTVHGVSDKEGVKDASPSDPEGRVECVSRDADGANDSKSGEEADLTALDEEFERLINGRFSEVYKRRTEGIIRRRLRSGKARPKEEVSDGVNESGVADGSENEAVKADQEPKTAFPEPTVGESLKTAKAINAARPIENGIGGSCGVVSRINVDALNGSDVLSILKRVGAGERIKFR